jgi:hypothetical protein
MHAPPTLFGPDISLQYSRFTTAFDLFSTQMAAALATVRRIAVNMETSPLFGRSKTVFTEWNEFLNEINRVSEAGLSPHISHLNRHFSVLFSGMNRLLNVITAANFRSDGPLSCWSESKPLIVRLRDICSDVFYGPVDHRFDDFIITDFERMVRDALRWLVQLFDRHIPRAVLPGGALSHLKTEMVTSLTALPLLMRSVQNFEPQLAELKRKVIEFNDALSSAQSHFGLPFAIELSLEVRQRREWSEKHVEE